MAVGLDKNAHICNNYFTNMKKRLLFYELIRYLPHKNVLVITGMRQVGKTTLMRQLYEELGPVAKLWFDLDNPMDQKIFEGGDYRQTYERLETLAGKKQKRLFICVDEIQNLPEITKFIKYAIDHFKIKFIVTGSSSFYLRNLFPESLSGRKFIYLLAPMNFSEYLYFSGKINLETALRGQNHHPFLRQDAVLAESRQSAYNNFLQFGGFPEVVLTENLTTKRLVLKNIFSSFFEKDLQILSDYKDIRELRDLILLLVPRVGQMLDISKLAGELGINRVRIYQYLEFLQGTFFIRLLPKFSRSIDRAVAGGKKVYFCDTGILTTIGSVNEGQLLENAVVNQLSGKGELAFYNQRNTAEIDLMVDKKIALEIKLKGSPRDLEKTAKLAKKLKLKETLVVSLSLSNLNKIISPYYW